MSGICGLVCLDDRPILDEHVRPIWAALSHLGPDSGTLEIDNNSVAFGHQMMRVTPESRCETQPWRHADVDVRITADARLDDRADLCRQLGIAAPERERCADGELIARAYVEWGERCTEHLVGDFAFALWDGSRRRLFCARDHMGIRPFYYHFDGARFVFASEAKGILATPGFAVRPNLWKLATIGMSGAFLVDNESTFFRNVNVLPPATRLILEGGRLRTTRYWVPDASAALPITREHEILEALGALVGQAIEDRLRSTTPVAALLSGGLDSSSVVGVAARALERRGARLMTLSAVVPDGAYAGRTDEREWVERFRDWPNIDAEYITDAERGPFDAVDELVRTAETPVLISRHYLYTAFAERARARGARVILDGLYGELGPTCHGQGYYAELLLRLRWTTLVRALAMKRRISGISLKADLLEYLIPNAILRPLRRGTRYTGWRFRSPLRHEFVRHELAGDLPRLEAAAASVGHNKPDLRANHHSLIAAVSRKNRDLRGFVGRETIDTRYPFLDKRVIEFCLAVPSDLKVRHGYHRYLARAALADALPPAIRWRTTKTAFSPDYHRRYDAQRKAAHATLAAMSPRDPVRAVVDIDRIAALAAHDVNTPGASAAMRQAALDVVPAAVYTVAFLRQFPEFRVS